MDKRLKFNEPWILQRADPYVYEKDGWYYFTASVPAYDSIVLRRAKNWQIFHRQRKWSFGKSMRVVEVSKHIWAPELHYLEGKWYIYFAGGEEEDIWKIRPYVLECQGQGHWQMHGWKKAKCSVQMGMNSRLKHSLWTQPYLRMPEIITT